LTGSPIPLKMKKMKTFTRVDQVVEWRLCLGCGACVPACPNGAISLVNVREQGIRPVVNSVKCRRCGSCVEVCPGIEISHRPMDCLAIPELRHEWGPVLEVWEGYATDSRIRYEGSSGGAVTALCLFCLEKEGAAGVLQIGARQGSPLENAAVFSKSRAELLRCTGSRYSPAAPCEHLGWIKEAGGKSVFVGKPCDVVALRKSQAVNPELDAKVGLAISIFCAGTPAMEGTFHILRILGVKPEHVRDIRYRGYGWPGATTVKTGDDGASARQMAYDESWGNILSHYGQFRCRLCPDSSGEFADISCCDPWYRTVQPTEPGRSLVLVRTARGRQLLHRAMEAGYLQLERVEPNTVPLSQKALLSRRRQLWGRLLIMQLMRVPVPCFRGFTLFSSWLRLSAAWKVRSLAGTAKRIVLRGWRKPLRPIVNPDMQPQADNMNNTPIDLDESRSPCRM
jgi:coenzyme F420 hydrogenase subunit beta